MIKNKIKHYIDKYLSFVDSNSDIPLNIEVNSDGKVKLIFVGNLSLTELEKINYEDLLMSLQYGYGAEAYIKNKLKPENFKYSDEAINSFLNSLDNDSLKWLDENIRNEMCYQRKYLFSNFKRILDIAGLYRYELSEFSVLKQLDKHILHVVIYDITDNEVNSNNNILFELKEMGYFKLFEYRVDDNGVLKSDLLDWKRKEIYSNLINNEKLLDNGFVRYIKSQNIDLLSLKDNETFEKFLTGSNSFNIKKTLDGIIKESNRINNMENRYISYSVSLSLEQIREIISGKSKRTLLLIDNRVRIGINLNYNYAFYFFIENENKIEIPYKNIKIIHMLS